MHLRSALAALCLASTIGLYAQQAEITFPRIGKPIPHFELLNTTHFYKKNVSEEDFKGKWLFLNFWTKTCISCVKSLPRVNEFQLEFNNSINWLLVGVNESRFNGEVDVLYEKIRNRQNLKLISAYDSLLYRKWHIWSMPHIIIIDPQGIVRHVTDGSDMTAQKIRRLIDNRDVSFQQKDIVEKDFNVHNIPDSLVLSRSLLTAWNGERYIVGEINKFVRWSDDQRSKGYHVVKAPLSKLYTLAYLGSWEPKDSLYYVFHPRPVLEMKDSSIFSHDYNKGLGLYNYSMLVPEHKSADREYLLSRMQHDLKMAFGFDVAIKEKEVQVWRLVTKQKAIVAKLKSGESKPLYDRDQGYGPMGFSAKGISSKDLLNRIKYYLAHNQPPFVDDTGIAFNVDIELDAFMADISEIRKSLNKNGLDLIKGTTTMKAIVIRQSQ